MKRRSPRDCTVTGCTRSMHAKGLCITHYTRATRGTLSLDAPLDRGRKRTDAASVGTIRLKTTGYLHAKTSDGWRYQHVLLVEQDRGCAITHLQCSWCPSPADVVHHADHVKTNNDLSNLVPLCEPCHQQHHNPSKAGA